MNNHEYHLAMYTFGVLKAPNLDPGRLTREFYESVSAIYDGIGQSAGYIAHAVESGRRAGTPFEADWGEWGKFAVPNWYAKGRAPESAAMAMTLSLWTDVRSAREFVYTGLHRSALNRRYDWFEKTGRPGFVIWWIPYGAIPTWLDGVSRLEHLQAHGPAPHAFTFQHPFDSGGKPAVIS